MSDSNLSGNQTLSKAFDVATQAFLHKPINSLVNAAYDYVAITYPDTITEVYTFKTGGSSGVTACVVTLTYTDATKASLSSAARS